MAHEPGEIITLAASAARTTGASGTGVDLRDGHWMPKRIKCVLADTAHATDAGDTLDVYIDTSWDGTTWINAGHFTQIAGNASPTGGPKETITLSVEGTPGTAAVAVSSDAAAGAVRPGELWRYLRARWAIADSGDGNSSHTFSVIAQVF